MKGRGHMKKQILIAFLISILSGAVPSSRAVEGSPAPAAPKQGDAAAARDSGTPGQSQSGAPSLQRRNPRYKLQVGDELEINFPLTPEYDQIVTIQPDGFINLQGLEDMHIDGMTTPELVSALKAAYAALLNDPEISVVLAVFDRPYFVAAGEFNTPGKFELKGTTTFLQAVAMAGGIKPGGKQTQVVLFRRASNDWVEVRKLNLKKIASSQRLGEDLEVMPGDLLYVPRSTWDKIDPYIPRPSMGLLLDPFQF
jgi:polysaccharide export outer membrane protein